MRKILTLHLVRAFMPVSVPGWLAVVLSTCPAPSLSIKYCQKNIKDLGSTVAGL